MSEICFEQHCRMTIPDGRTYEGQPAFCNVSGVLLTMDDGRRWFHPYNGGKAVLVDCSNEGTIGNLYPSAP